MAWVFREYDRYYAPGYFWPDDVEIPTGDSDLEAYVALFASRGFMDCDDGNLEPGLLKIALYATGDAFHHVAKQLPGGEWSSKIGEAHDLYHELTALEESLVYFDNAIACRFMKREYDQATETFNLEYTGLV